MAYPILAPNSTWYKSSVARSTITEINIVDSYTPTGSENETWNADVNNTGSIKCYRTGTVLTMAGNGSGKIAMNADSSRVFSSTTTDRFTKLIAINGLNNLDASEATTFLALFRYCESLTTLSVGSWNTSKVVDMHTVFSNCFALTSVDVDEWDTSACTTMVGMFQHCIALNSLDLSSWDVGKVTSFQNFAYTSSTYGFMSITSFGDITNWNTSSCTSMQSMFARCAYLTALNVSKWDVSKVTTLYAMFTYCTSLTTLDVSNWRTSVVTNMQGVFDRCTSLTTLNVSNWDVSNVTTTQGMFYGCTSLTTLDVSNWDVSKVTTMDSMFGNMTSLDKITLGVNFSFNGNGTATRAVLPTPSADYIEGADGNWYNITTGTAYAPNAVPNGAGIYYAANYPTLAPNSTWYKSSSARDAITAINIVKSYTPTGNENETWNADINNSGSIKCYRTGTVVTMAGNGTSRIFANADSSYVFSSSTSDRFSNVATINGCDVLDTSNVATFERMFQYCNNLATVDVSHFNTSKAESMRAMFNYCTVINNLSVSDWDTSNVTTMLGMFNYCQALTVLNAANWNVGKVDAMNAMFQQCVSLKELYASSWDTSNVTDMSNMFYHCQSLKMLDVSKWDVSNVTNMQAMFQHCVSLTALDVSNWDVSKVTTMNSMFSMSNYGAEVSSLTSLDVSNWDTSSCTNMGWMFYGLNRVKTLDVSKWDVSKVDSLHHFAAHAYIELIGVENWDVSSCRAFNATFYSCQNTSLDLSGWDVSKGVTFAQMFEGSGSLVEIKGLENWNTSNGRDFAEMFLNCPSLKRLDLSSFDTRNASPSYTDEWNSQTGGMSDMFTNARSLEKITLGENFSFNGDGTAALAVLPTPDATYISGADGNWYDKDGNPYAVSAIPTGAGTYYAAVSLIDGTYFIRRGTLIGLGDAVRSKTGVTDRMTPDEMIVRINEISIGGGVNITFNNYSVIDDGNGNITIKQ